MRLARERSVTLGSPELSARLMHDEVSNIAPTRSNAQCRTIQQSYSLSTTALTRAK
jgi:hypothetical protein